MDWDPEVVAALDDALDLEDADNVLDDDFVLQANTDTFADAPGDGVDGLFGRRSGRRGLMDSHDDDDDDGDDDDDDDGDDDGEYEDEDGSDVGSSFDGLGEDDFFDQDDVRGLTRRLADQGDEVKSRFTEYSMSSSILPRSELQQVHDSHFEKLYEQYDDDQIGALDEEEDEIGGLQVLCAFFYKQRKRAGEKMK